MDKRDQPRPLLLQRLQRASSQPLIIAHRGYRACFPENTLLSFERSLGRCDMIELDVRLSGDGEVVVFHDELLTRTTDVLARDRELSGRSLRVSDWTVAQLKQLDAGSWFLDTDPFGSLGSGLVQYHELRSLMPQPIPTLHQVLSWCRRHALPLNVELKDAGCIRENRRLVDAVIAAIKRLAVEHLILLSSFNHELLHACRRLAPEICRAALVEHAHPDELCLYLQNLGVCAYHPQDMLVDNELISMLSAIDIAVNVFTVNEPKRKDQLASFGANGLITDFLSLLK